MAKWLNTGEVPKQAGNEHPQGVPTGVYASSDGYFNIAAPSTKLWLLFCDAVGKPEWKDNADWQLQSGRRRDRKIINAAIAEITKTQTTEHWIKTFDGVGIPCGPIYTVDQVFGDPQVQQMGIATPIAHPRLGKLDLVASPLNFSGLKKELRSATPDAGQYTAEILKNVGYSENEIADLRKRGIAG